MQGLGVTLIYAFAALLGLALYTLQAWLSVPTVVLLGTLLVGLPGAALAVWVTPSLREDLTARDLAPLLLVGLLVGAGVSALWALPPVRATAIGMFGQEVALARAVVDPSPRVQLEACRKLVVDRAKLGAMTSALGPNPRLAGQCMQLPEYASYVARADLERRLLSDWGYALRASGLGPAEESSACLMADVMTRFEADGQIEGPLRVLGCAIQSSSTVLQRCCTQALQDVKLTGGKLQSLMLKAAAMTQAQEIPGPLVATSFGEPQTSAKLAGVTSPLGLEGQATRAIALKLTCDAYLQGQPRQLPYLSWVFASSSSCLDADERAREEDVTASALCFELTEALLQSDDAQAEICQGKKRVLAELKAAQERRLRLNREAMSELSDNIDAGHSYRRNRHLTMDGLVKSIEAQRLAAEQGGSVMPFDTFDAKDQDALIESMRAQAMGLAKSDAEIAKLKRDAEKTLSTLAQNPQMKEMMDLKGKDGKLSKSEQQRLDALEKGMRERESKATPEERRQFKLDEE